MHVINQAVPVDVALPQATSTGTGTGHPRGDSSNTRRSRLPSGGQSEKDRSSHDVGRRHVETGFSPVDGKTDLNGG